MFIADLNYLEAVDTNVAGGSYRPGSNFYFDKKIYINEYINKNVYKNVFAYANVYGNTADAEAVADAYGNNSLSETLTVTKATGYSSNSYSGSLSAVGPY
jgi:hypothetical protein